MYDENDAAFEPESSFAVLPIKHRPLSEVVADQITGWIMDGTLRAGQKLNSEALSRKLGVSRTPIREALRALEQAGLVSSTPYVGTSVNTLLIEDINEIYQLRELLESFVIDKVVANATEADISDLEGIQARFEAEVEAATRDTKVLFKLNQEFHMRLYAISKMQRLCEMIRGLWASLSFFRLVHASNQTYGGDAKREHRDYISALRRKDAGALKTLTIANLTRHAEQMPELVLRHNAGLKKKKK